MHVLALEVSLRFPNVGSLKAKRSALRPITEGIRQRFRVAVAEVGHADSWQLADIGVSAVSGSVTELERVIDDVERFIWSFPDVDVLEASRHWLDVDR